MRDDALNRNKVKRGEQLPQSKLTDEDVKIIRELVEYRDKIKKELSGLTNSALAEKFDVSQRTIDRITAGYGWAHV